MIPLVDLIFKGSRVRLRRYSIALILMSVLVLATFMLISLVPSGTEKRPVNEPNKRPINPKFQPLISGDKEDNQAIQSVNNIGDNGVVVAPAPASDDDNKMDNNLIRNGNNKMKHIDETAVAMPTFSYGDKYAFFEENRLGNYEDIRSPLMGRNGDAGKPFKLDGLKDIDHQEVHSLKSQYGMNIAASQLIPMDRSVPDIRLDECKFWHYGENLPTASVVVVFHNEGLSTLMRTVHSILLRSPRQALREVLLVDDFSDKLPLKEELNKYLLDHFGPFKHHFDPTSYSKEKALQGEELDERSGKVRLIRNVKREGLIRSRSRGANDALGDVIVFLDAHCEVNHNWLPPLLAPIARDKKTLTVPIIDGIDSETFEYRSVYSRPDQHYQGIWEWGMYYKEIEVDMDKHLKTHKVSEPYEAPTHAGGLFAIAKDYFLELGTYDPDLLVWGGENFELSFKVWQCGGNLLWVPCSRVGHVYRPFMPYSFGSLANKRKGPLIITNYKRVIEVWWDQKYRDYFYTREPLATFYDPGDVSAQLAIKDKLQCKSFDWFMDRIGHVVYKHFPALPANVHWGEVRNKATDKCLDTGSSAPPRTVHLSTCHSSGGNQLFRLNEEGQLGVGERCIDADNHKMSLIYCKLGTVDGPWSFDEHTKQMVHTSTTKCLQFFKSDSSVKLTKCDPNEVAQQWIWKKITPYKEED
ncbi:N-acetylgalactosaminyltransferase 7-like [Panonychus citri]|uniref:N-acetylgalactosaminyltransferase 7-like n=1 Tax=Panonychus citri TaxID=50023 RepID=UPI002306EE8A|nr:N-acetylgalactosaminyltransferase 7-like [Panonychus citri]